MSRWNSRRSWWGASLLVGAVLTIFKLFGAPAVRSQETADEPSSSSHAQTFTFEDNGKLLANPGCGWQRFGGASNYVGFIGDTVYARFNWSVIEPTVGTYNFDKIDDTIAAMRRPMRLAFRIMTFDDDDIGPVAYANAGLAGTWADYADKRRFQPDLNDSRVQAAVTRLIKALGEKYSDPTWIDSFDIGFFGPWGEWSESNVFKVPVPTLPTCQWLVQTTQEAFPRTPVFVNAFMDIVPGAMSFALKAGCGWRGDSWGDHPRGTKEWTNQGDLYAPIIAQHPDHWKTAPIYMEPAYVISEWSEKGIDWKTVAQWTIDNHIAAIHDKWDAQLLRSDKERIFDLLKKIGYRPLISKIVFNVDTLELTIRNNGNVPCYVDRKLRIYGGTVPIDTDINLKGLLPGEEQFTVTDDRLRGAGALSFGFVDSTGDADIQLAQDGVLKNLLTIKLGE